MTCEECARCHARCLPRDAGEPGCRRCHALGARCAPQIRSSRSMMLSLKAPKSDADASAVEPTVDELTRRARADLALLVAGAGDGEAHFEAAASLRSLAEALAAEGGVASATPPRGELGALVGLRGVSAALFLVARVHQSVRRLHAATCLAAALGLTRAMDWLVVVPDKVPLSAVASLEREVHRRTRFSPLDGATVAIRMNAGRREVLVNQAFEHFFASAYDVLAALRDSGLSLELPTSFPRPEQAEDFLTQLVTSLLARAEPVLGGDQVIWAHESSAPVELRDRSGALFEATLVGCGGVAEQGLFATAALGLRGLAPKDDAARKRWAEFKAAIQATIPAEPAGTVAPEPPLAVAKEDEPAGCTTEQCTAAHVGAWAAAPADVPT